MVLSNDNVHRNWISSTNRSEIRLRKWLWYLVEWMFLNVVSSVRPRAQSLLWVFDEEALDEVFGQRAHVFGERRVLL